MQSTSIKGVYDDLRALARVSLDMRRYGILTSDAAITAHRSKLVAEMEAVNSQWLQLPCVAGSDVGLGAAGTGPKIAKFFFDALKAPVLATSMETGTPSLDAWTLQQYSIKDLGPATADIRCAAATLLRYRRAAKLLGTYIDGLERGPDGVVHPSWKVWGAITGRWSCARPNIQNIPKQKGRNLRDIMVSRPGYTFVGADYDKLELRIIAILAGDEALLDAFSSGVDVHQNNARDIFQTEPTPEQRDFAKRFVYGCNYLAEEETLYDALVVEFPKINLAQVAHLRRQWFKKHPWISAWHTKVIREARDNLGVWAPVGGRFETFPDGRIEPNKVVNFPVQAIGAYLANRATLGLAQEESGRLLFQVHDELTGETKEPARYGTAILKHMQAPILLNGQEWVFPAELKKGTDWGHQEKFKC